MIEIQKENKYKVLKPEVFLKDKKLLGKYTLWENTAMHPKHLCFVKGFGTSDDRFYGTDTSVWFGFNPETKELKLHCSSYGGMCGFVFDEETLKSNDLTLSKNDKECMEFTINLIKELQDNGIIEKEKDYMTFKELQDIAKRNHYTFEDNHDFWKLTSESQGDINEINISKKSVRVIFLDINFVSDEDMDVIEASIQYCNTPIDEREQESRYIIPLPKLVTTDGKQQYLTQRGDNWFACRRTETLRQTWKEEHLQYIPQEYRKYAVILNEE